jgi:hypothetical protein
VGITIPQYNLDVLYLGVLITVKADQSWKLRNQHVNINHIKGEKFMFIEDSVKMYKEEYTYPYI